MAYLTFFSVLFAASIALAELPQTLWTRTYGGSNFDAAFCGKPTADGGYILSGYTQSYGPVGQNLWVVRVNSNGDTLYRRFVGGSSSDAAFDVYADSNFVYTIGNTSSFGTNPSDIYFVKLNSSGDTVLTRSLDVTSAQEVGLGIDTAATASAFYIAGWRDDGSSQPNMLLTQVTTGGTVVWTRTLGGANTDWAFDVLTVPDGGCFLIGQSPLYDNGLNPKENVFLVRYDVNGDTLWTKRYGQSQMEEKGKRMISTSDGNYLIIASKGGIGSQDIYVIKIDPNGNEIWSRVFGGGGDDDPSDVSETCDGGFLIGARSNSYGAGNYDLYLIRTNADGDTLWTKTFGGTQEEHCYSVYAQCSGMGEDEGYWAAGYTRSYGAGSADMYLIRLDAEPMLEVFGPGLCEEYTVGQNFTVTWQSRGNLSNPYVKIELNRDYPNGTWELLSDSTADDGSESFTATAPASPNCRVRLSFLWGGLSDEASGNFQIIPTGIFQNPTVQWDSVYNGGASLPDVVLTSDGNYASNYGISIIKRDTMGAMIWTANFTYDHDYWTEPNTYAVTQLSNGDLVAVGKMDTIELTADRSRAIFLYADANGTPLNTIGPVNIRNFPTIGTDIVTDENGDGFWALANVHSGNDFNLAGVFRAPAGGGDWQDTIRTASFFPQACAIADNDGLLIAGQIGDIFVNEVDLFLVRIDSDGDTLWTRRHDFGQNEMIEEIRRFSNSNYVLVGVSSPYLAGPTDYLAVTIDADGNVLQQWTHHIANEDDASGVAEDADGGIVMAGSSQQSSQTRVAHLLKFGCSGELLWNLSRSSADGRLYQKIQRTQNGYIVSGGVFVRSGPFVSTRPNLVKYGPEIWTPPPTCPKADSVVIQYLSGNVRLTWIGEEAGVYVIYATTATAENGNPPGNGWQEVGCMEPIPPAASILQWTDTNISAVYKRYAIIHQCSGSCGGGGDD